MPHGTVLGGGVAARAADRCAVCRQYGTARHGTVLYSLLRGHGGVQGRVLLLCPIGARLPVFVCASPLSLSLFLKPPLTRQQAEQRSKS